MPLGDNQESSPKRAAQFKGADESTSAPPLTDKTFKLNFLKLYPKQNNGAKLAPLHQFLTANNPFITSGCLFKYRNTPALRIHNSFQ